ncbi:MAG: hypothetical protein IT160_13855 [Bryobacterales bacterium]|nr:hypothetical protein [Bryobacterales bacterium]
MTKLERVEAVYNFRPPDRIPFVPAIYEHKAALIGRSPSDVCRNADLLHAALLKELEVYDPDMLVIGIDVYNVEAEALGCKVVYFEDSNDVPGVIEPIIKNPSDLASLGVPDPAADARMPVYLDVARRLARGLSSQMVLRGAVTGPYSMAAELLGAEPFVIATVEQPEFAARLIDFCAKVTLAFSLAFLEAGVQPIIFDSRATPALASPRVVRQLVLPVYRDFLIPELKKAGAWHLPLIIGGKTTSIVDDLIATGCTQILCDAVADKHRFRQQCTAARMAWRINVDARLVNRGPIEAIREDAAATLAEFGNSPGLLFGCGVIAYDTSPEYGLAVRQAIDEFCNSPLCTATSPN